MLLLGTLGLVAFGAICWVVLLASVAAVHAQYDELTDISSLLSDVDFDKDDVADLTGLSWWMVWYKFLLLIAVGATAAMGMLKQFAPVLGNFLAALFALLMYNSHQAAVLSRSAEGSTSSFESRANAYLAGCIMCGLSTALLIMWLGIVPTFATPGNQPTHGNPPPPGNQPVATKNWEAPQHQPYGYGAPQGQAAGAAPAQPQYKAPAPQQHQAPPQQYGAPPGQPGAQYGANTGTGGSYSSATPPGAVPQPLAPIPQAQEQGYGHAPPAPQGPGGTQPPPLPPAGATAYGQPPY